jgi:hypothetical protein
MLWDLPTLIAGAPPLNADRFIQGIIKWFNSLTQPIQAAVSRLISALWLQLQNLVGLSGGSGGGMTTFWPIAVNTMKSFYDSGTLWSFYGAISKSLSWFDYLLIVGNLLKFALMVVGTPVMPAAPAVFYATSAACWVVNTTQDILGVIKACGPYGLSFAASRALAALSRSVQIAIATSKSFSKLNLFEQADVTNALLNPHWTRIYLGGQIVPPSQHLGGALKGRLRIPGIPTDPALHDFMSQEYRLSNAAAATVTELRPQIEKALTELEPKIPTYLPAPAAATADVKKADITVTPVNEIHT